MSTLGVSAADQEQLQILERTKNKDKAGKASQAAAASMEATRLKREMCCHASGVGAEVFVLVKSLLAFTWD